MFSFEVTKVFFVNAGSCQINDVTAKSSLTFYTKDLRLDKNDYFNI
jgi:hypothetical protein